MRFIQTVVTAALGIFGTVVSAADFKWKCDPVEVQSFYVNSIGIRRSQGPVAQFGCDYTDGVWAFKPWISLPISMPDSSNAGNEIDFIGKRFGSITPNLSWMLGVAVYDIPNPRIGDLRHDVFSTLGTLTYRLGSGESVYVGFDTISGFRDQSDTIPNGWYSTIGASFNFRGVDVNPELRFNQGVAGVNSNVWRVTATTSEYCAVVPTGAKMCPMVRFTQRLNNDVSRQRYFVIGVQIQKNF